MTNRDTLFMEINADGTAGISFHATAEHGSFVEMEEIPLEHVSMDADRQKLELDITQEFEFADGEATLLIDEAG